MKKYLQRNVVWGLAAGGAIAVSILTVLAQSVPQPVLSITSLGTNQFQIGITNGVTNALYELYWVRCWRTQLSVADAGDERGRPDEFLG